MKLVDDFIEQRTLETLLDAKPPVPTECQHLDYLLFTPFRYAARGDSHSPRRPDPGVFYAAERIETSGRRVAFWRLLFSSARVCLGP
jgi:hypothetical protein